MQSRPKHSVITNQTLHNLFFKSSNVSVMNVNCPLFKLSVQNVHQLQQHTIEVSFEMAGLPYQWTPVANHYISIAKQSSARHPIFYLEMLVGFGAYFW